MGDDVFSGDEEPKKPEEHWVSIGDGALVENFPLIELVLRKIRCPIMFGNFYTPIDPAYNASSDDFGEEAPTNTDIRALFFDVKGRKDLKNINYEENRIFPSEDWAGLIKAFQ